MEEFLQYSPILIAVMIFLVQQRIIVTPEQLEKKHREIIEDVEERFVTIHSFQDLKEQFSEMKDKIDKINDCVIQNGMKTFVTQELCIFKVLPENSRNHE